MINCPSCNMSNLGTTHCSYCKAPLPEEGAETSVFASVTHYATVESAMTETVGTAAVLTVLPEARSQAVDAEPDRPAPTPKAPREKKADTRELEALKAFEERRKQKPAAHRGEPLPPLPRAMGPFAGPAVLSAILPGLGQVIKGMPEWGFVLLAGVSILAWFGWTWVMVPLWAYNVYDAYQNSQDSVGERIREYLRKLPAA